MSRTRPSYPPAYRARILEQARAGRSPEDLAEEYEPTAQTIRNRMEQSDLDAGQRTDGLTTDEKVELRRLCRENARLREEREILGPVDDGEAREVVEAVLGRWRQLSTDPAQLLRPVWQSPESSCRPNLTPRSAFQGKQWCSRHRFRQKRPPCDDSASGLARGSRQDGKPASLQGAVEPVEVAPQSEGWAHHHHVDRHRPPHVAPTLPGLGPPPPPGGLRH